MTARVAVVTLGQLGLVGSWSPRAVMGWADHETEARLESGAVIPSPGVDKPAEALAWARGVAGVVSVKVWPHIEGRGNAVEFVKVGGKWFKEAQ